jgi:hypothetical protein
MPATAPHLQSCGIDTPIGENWELGPPAGGCVTPEMPQYSDAEM